jgi:O-antigen/teichoic acid export membrane protein/serine acetyltransferase
MDLKISSLLTSASGVFRLVVGIVSAPLLVRALGIADYGLWTVANSLVLLLLIVDFGVNVAIVTYLSADIARKDTSSARQHLSTSLLIVMASGCIFAAALLFAMPWYGPHLFPDPADRARALPILSFASIGLPLRLWQTWAAAVEGALLRFDWQTAVELPSSLAIQVGSVVVAALGGGVLGLAVLQLAVLLLTSVVHGWALNKILPVGISVGSFSAQALRELVGFGAIHWVTSMGNAIYNQGGRLVVNAVLGPAAAGVYTALTTVANKIVELTVLPMKVLPAAISGAHAVQNLARVQHLFRESMRLNSAVTWTCASGLFFFAEPLMRLVLGREYIAIAPTLLRAVTLIYALQSLCIAASWFALGLNRPSILTRWGLPSAAVTILAMYYLAREFGLAGAVWSNAAYLMFAGLVFHVGKAMLIPAAAAAKIFVPGVLALLGGFAVTSLPAYRALPLWAQLIVFVIAAPLTLLNIIGVRRLREVIPELMTTLPILRDRRRGLEEFMEGSDMQQTGIRSLLRLIWEDRIAHAREIMLPGFHAIVLHRCGVWAETLPSPLRQFLLFFYEIGYVFIRNIYKINLYRTTVVGRRVAFGNQGNITIHRESVLGDGCVIRQNVTIGGVSKAKNVGPILEADVEVGAGAVIMGRITIGKGAKIGPNAVITQDVPAGAIAIAPATRILEPRRAPARKSIATVNGSVPPVEEVVTTEGPR